MASSAAASSSTSVTLPTSLAFLVSNFHSLVNMKLNSENYLLWRTQVMNALRANGYLEYLDYTKPSPEPTIRDTSNSRVENPEFTLWTLVDNQLLSCLTSSLSSTALPHVLGLTHTCQVWQALEHRFNSLSRSHMHELKNKLYNVRKTGSMDDYVDEIRGYAQKLEAIGYHVDDDDLVFYALKGLPPEFKPVRSALQAKGDVMFDELTTILKNEELQLERDEGLGSAKVFLATSQSSAHEAARSGNQMMNNPQVMQSGLLGSIPQYYQAPMYQNSHDTNAYFPAQTSGNVNFGGSNRQKGGKGPYGQNNKIECQICGKTNHTALYCYHRQNLQYQPPANNYSYQGQGSRRGQPWNGSQNTQGWNSHNWNRSQRSSQNWNSGVYPAQQQPLNVVPQQPQANFHTYTNGYMTPSQSFNVSPGYSTPLNVLPQQPQIGYTPSQALMVTTPSVYSGVSPTGNTFSGVSQALVATAPPVAGHGQYGQNSISGTSSPQWFFDSGATSHVTNDITNISQPQSCISGDGVIVGHSNSQNSAQGSLCTGVVSHHDLL